MGTPPIDVGRDRAESARDLVPTLWDQRRAWDRKPALRALYTAWYAQMVDRLAAVPGRTVELGCGIGSFKEHYPAVLATDVAETPWAELVADAERLPFDAGSLANLVMTDVIHHVPHPAGLLSEAERVLRPGGRLIAIEPYYSPLSGLVYRFAHHEGADPRADPFAAGAQSSADPLDANNALPTVIFWRREEALPGRFPGLRVLERRRFAMFAYPLSGGFTRRQLLPDGALRTIARLEDRLLPLAALAAFRCLVVLERTKA